MDPISAPVSKEMIATHNLHVVARGRDRWKKREKQKDEEKRTKVTKKGEGERNPIQVEEVNHSKIITVKPWVQLTHNYP